MSCESATARDKSDHSSLFLRACSTYWRDDAGAFDAPNRRAEGEVHGFIAGYRMTVGAAPSRFAPKMMAAEWRALSAFLSAWSTYRRDDAGAFDAPNRRAEGEVYGLHRRISHDSRGRTVTFCAKNDGGGMQGLMAFLSAWSTHRRDDAGAFDAPNRQAEGEVHAFIAGYRVTLGAAPSRFAPKMMSGEWKALSASLLPSVGSCA